MTGPSGAVEHETFTCKHCNSLHVVPHRAVEKAGGFCMQCWGMLCPGCAKLGRCTPFEQKIEDQARRDANARALGLRLR